MAMRQEDVPGYEFFEEQENAPSLTDVLFLLVDIGHGVSSGVMEVTPALAKEMLASGQNIRNLTAKLKAYVADIEAGKWDLTHQGICFNSEGQLIDGFHRLTAVVQAGKPALMVVSRVCGLEIDSTIDQMATRKPLTILQSRLGKHVRSNLIAALDTLMVLEQYSNAKPSIAQKEEIYAKIEELMRDLDKMAEQFVADYAVIGRHLSNPFY